MTDYTPVKKFRKYFFGYYNFFGQAAPVMWAEEDGITVGGHPHPIIQKDEITEEEFNKPDVLTKMSQKYPVRIDMTLLLLKES